MDDRRLRWDDLRFVGAVARHGSLLAAGAALGVDHSTVSRRVAAAERALGTTLFVRTVSGLVLTADGQQLLEPLTAVEQAVLAVERRAEADAAVSGAVRVTAAETFACVVLAPRLARLSQRHPGLVLELDASGARRDLHRREAEIAVRGFRTRGASLLVRRAGEVPFAAYAARALLAHRPVRRAADLAGMPLLLSSDADADTRWLRALAPASPVALRCELALGLHAAVRAGAGVGVLPRYLGDADDTLVRLPLPGAPREEVFLTVHRDLRRAPRVRTVLEFLAAELSTL